MEQDLSVKLHNRFDIEVRDAKTGELKQQAYAENIILDQAWAQILYGDSDGYDRNNPGWFTTIYFGTGTGTMAASRTSLFTQLSSKAAANTLYGGSPKDGYYNVRRDISILETEYNGQVLTEVGIGNTVLCTHALLKDMNGNQVAITKQNTDILTIYATVYLKIPVFSFSDNISLIPYVTGSNPLVCCLLGVRRITQSGYYDGYTNYPESIYVAAEDSHSAIVWAYNAAMTRAFDVANKKVTYYHRIPAASANVGGLKSYILTAVSGQNNNYTNMVIGRFKESMLTQSAVIEQIGTGDGTTTVFATAFPFVKAGAIIKVDGAVTEATVITGVPKIKNIRGYMRNLGINGEYSLYPANFVSTIGNDNYPSGASVNPIVLENPFYATYGIDSIKVSYTTLFTSDDMITWTQVYTTTAANQTYTVDAAQKQKRYWRFQKSGTNGWTAVEININAFDSLKNVIFATAPATGVVITAEYNPDLVAKDVNHVLDINITIQLGEYIP